MTDMSHPQVSGIPDGSRSASRIKAAHEGPAEWLGHRLTWMPSLLVSWIVANVGALILAAGMIGLGYFTTEVLLSIEAVQAADEWLPAWLEANRTPFLNDVSYIASNMSHAPVLIPLVGVVVLMLVLRGRWRTASFPVQAGLAEKLAYGLTVLLIVRLRPPVERLDSFTETHSFPSGHVGAGIAVYGSLALLLTAHVKAAWARTAIWTVTVGIVFAVAWSRVYRGSHHTIDIAAGMLLGVAALLVALFAARTARTVAEIRAAKRTERAAVPTLATADAQS
jgi:membrane-associated phospholipid phosphatase